MLNVVQSCVHLVTCSCVLLVCLVKCTAQCLPSQSRPAVVVSGLTVSYPSTRSTCPGLPWQRQNDVSGSKNSYVIQGMNCVIVSALSRGCLY